MVNVSATVSVAYPMYPTNRWYVCNINSISDEARCYIYGDNSKPQKKKFTKQIKSTFLVEVFLAIGML